MTRAGRVARRHEEAVDHLVLVGNQGTGTRSVGRGHVDETGRKRTNGTETNDGARTEIETIVVERIAGKTKTENIRNTNETKINEDESQ